VRDHVLFLGKHASVDELLPCADLFLLPSENESFGLAALEAMASGAPVVASNAGGLTEVIEHGVSGYLLPVGAVDEMSEAGIRLLTDTDLRERVATAARARAIDRFSADRVASRYEDLYRRVIEGGQR
jgi:L-malate glycosyltransferase